MFCFLWKANRRLQLEPEEAGDQNKRARKETSLKLVEIAYQRMTKNFDQARAYDLSEDCFVGAMEMKRLNPPLHQASHSGQKAA